MGVALRCPKCDQDNPEDAAYCGSCANALVQDVTCRNCGRVNPTSEASGGALRMGGKPSPFGIDEEMLDPVLDHVLSQSSIELTGVHLYTGTQILDHTILLNQYRKGIEIARRVAARLQRPLQTLDFGGGLGIPYFHHERELSLNDLGKGLAVLTRELENDPLLLGTRFIIEPGRFLVAEAGIYVTRVNEIKVSRSKRFLIVDGGMNHHLAASGNLGQMIKRNYPVAILNKLHCPHAETADVVGPLCTPLDVLARAMQFPHAELDDLVGVFQSGAYARTSSPMGFLSHPAPPEIWVEQGQHQLIRRRGEFDDSLQDQQLPCSPSQSSREPALLPTC